MSAQGYKLSDILDDTYSEFFEYCRIAKKEYSGELTSSDYIAFRTKFAKTREYVNELRKKVENFTPSVSKNKSSDTDEEVTTDEQVSADNDFCLDYGTIDFSTYGDYIDVPEALTTNEENIAPDEPSSETVSEENAPESATNRFNKLLEVDSIDDNADDFDNSDCDSAFYVWVKRENASIAQIFDIEDTGPFSDVPTEFMGLSVRAGNVLRTAGYDNMAKVIALSHEQLMSLKNAGNTTAKNVFENVFRLINDKSSVIYQTGVKPQRRKKTSFHTVQCTKALAAYLRDEEFDLTSLTEKAAEEYNRRLPLTEELRDITLFALENAEYTAVVINGLFEFYSVYDKIREQKNEIYDCINERVKDLKVEVCYKVYLNYKKTPGFSINKTEIRKATVKDFADMVVSDIDKYSEDELSSIKKFFKWIDFDVDAACCFIFGFFNSNGGDRLVNVLNGRIAKRTLEEIAGDYDITRERVRQMESKSLRKIRSRIYDYSINHGCNIWDMIFIMSGGKSIINRDIVASLVGEQYASWLWYEMQTSGNDKYSKDFDAIVMDNTVSEETTAQFFALIPELIEKYKAEEMICNFAEKYNADKEFLKLEFLSRYNQVGTFYSCTRITTKTICSYLLKYRFPQGFKTGNSEERKKFDRYTTELFGEQFVFDSQHALDSAIGKFGVLCDRGKYIHPDFVNIDESLFGEIMEYIENSPNKAVPYSEIYNALEHSFMGTQITNRFMLQGFIGMHDVPYALTRDYIQKEKDANVLGEIEKFIKENSPVHRDEIIDRFPFVDELYTAALNMKCRDIIYIGSGFFIHSSGLIISDEEKTSIRELLLKRCSIDHVNVRPLLNDFYDLYPDLMMDNEIEDHHKLFAILRFLCDDVLNFDKPYISMEMGKRITNYGVLREKIGDRTEISISEIFDICKDLGIADGAVTGTIRGLSPEYIRVDEDLMMRTELTGVDEEIIDEVVGFINNKVNISDYCPSRKFNDLIWLTEINVPWNPFLIESVAELSDDRVNIIRQKTGNIHYTQDVYVSDKYASYDYNELVVELLIKRHSEYPFKTKTEIINWLKYEGLSFSNNLPKFLQDIVKFDGSGKIVIG